MNNLIIRTKGKRVKFCGHVHSLDHSSWKFWNCCTFYPSMIAIDRAMAVTLNLFEEPLFINCLVLCDSCWELYVCVCVMFPWCIKNVTISTCSLYAAISEYLFFYHVLKIKRSFKTTIYFYSVDLQKNHTRLKNL